MASLKDCNVLIIENICYPLGVTQNSQRVIFQGSGGPDRLDHRKIILSISKEKPDSEKKYYGSFEIQYLQENQNPEYVEKGSLYIRTEGDAFSVFPVGEYHGLRKWILRKI